MKRIIDLQKDDIIHVLDITYGYYNQYVVDDVVISELCRTVDLFIHKEGEDSSDEMITLKYTGCHTDHYILYNEQKSKRLLSISTSVEKMRSIAWEFAKVSRATVERLIMISETTDEWLGRENYKFF